DERRLALVSTSSPPDGPLAPTTLLAGGACGCLCLGLLPRPLPVVTCQAQPGPQLGHEGGADRALEPRRRPSLVHCRCVGIRMVVEELVDEARLAQAPSGGSSRHECFSRREVAALMSIPGI